MNSAPRLVVCSLFLAAASIAGTAIFIQPDVENVPVDRVVANLEKQLASAPDDVTLLVNLARVHAMAFATKGEVVPRATFSGSSIPDRVPWQGSGVPNYKQFPVRETTDPKRLAEARAHLDRAIERYRRAVELAPDNLVAKLGLGWSLIQRGERAEARRVLREVVKAAATRDDSDAFGPFHGHPFLTEEAAAYLIPLLDPAADAQEIETLRRRAEELSRRPRPITPIAVPLRDALTAFDIADDHGGVLFDADGSGIPKRWTWIRDNAAWLVFDRHRTGRVTSALQLFGSVTFWLFWENGYRALGALDDNHDGELRGAELDGLALWHDRNRDGVSDAGEVRPIAAWGILALSTRYGHDPAHPDEIAYSPDGVTFRDGTRRPTYDLVLRSRRR